LKLGAQISIWHKDSRKGRVMIKNHMHTHMYIHIQYTRMYIHTHTYVCTHSVRHLLPAPPPCLDQECGYNRGILCHMYAHTHTHYTRVHIPAPYSTSLPSSSTRLRQRHSARHPPGNGQAPFLVLRVAGGRGLQAKKRTWWHSGVQKVRGKGRL
jgi:hypothetical protein